MQLIESNKIAEVSGGEMQYLPLDLVIGDLAYLGLIDVNALPTPWVPRNIPLQPDPTLTQVETWSAEIANQEPAFGFDDWVYDLYLETGGGYPPEVIEIPTTWPVDDSSWN